MNGQNHRVRRLTMNHSRKGHATSQPALLAHIQRRQHRLGGCPNPSTHATSRHQHLTYETGTATHGLLMRDDLPTLAALGVMLQRSHGVEKTGGHHTAKPTHTALGPAGCHGMPRAGQAASRTRSHSECMAAMMSSRWRQSGRWCSRTCRHGRQ